MRMMLALGVAGLLGSAAVAQAPAQSWEPYTPTLQARADAGEALAQFQLGEAYRTGNGIAPDREQAMAWYRRAAPIDVRAADALGILLFTKGERKEAMPLLQGAALRSNAYALYILGTARFNGDYVPKDLGRAYADMKIAAKTLPQAQRSLALMEPYITPVDRTRADQLAALEDGPESGAPAAPAYATAPPPPKPRTAAAKKAATVAQNPPKLVTAPPWSDVPLPPPSSGPLPDIAATTPASSIRALDLPASQPAATPASRAVKPTPTLTRPVVIKAAPAPKPATVAAAKAADTETTPSAPKPAATGGKWRVQLGAYASEDKANAQWTMFAAKLPELAKLTKSTSPAGTGPLVRLQATGIASREEATALCSAATAIKAPCMVLSQ